MSRVKRLSRVLFLCLVAIATSNLPGTLQAGQRFQRGNSNGDDRFDLTDAIYTLEFLFRGTPASLSCMEAADSNDDGKVNLSDPVHTLRYLFLGMPAPAAPFPGCGEDLTPDQLGCQSFVACPVEATKELFLGRLLETGARPLSVAIGDLDGDGKADLAVANFGSNTVSVLRNQGDGTFAAQVGYAVGDSPRSVALRDLDGDGKADLAVANYGVESRFASGGTVSVLRNQTVP